MVMFIDFVRGGFISHSKAIARSCPGMLTRSIAMVPVAPAPETKTIPGTSVSGTKRSCRCCRRKSAMRTSTDQALLRSEGRV